MKNMIKAAACVAVLAGASAHAETFDFSYKFDDGSTVTGSLEGSLVGDSLQNVSDIHAALNGIAFTGTLNATGFDSSSGLFDGAAVISTNAARNSFVFADVPDAAGVNAGNFTNLFEITANGVFAGNAHVLENNSAFDLSPNSSWSLRPVPLPAGFLLFSSGLGLFGTMRRRLSAKAG